jgi:hypothetical protein
MIYSKIKTSCKDDVFRLEREQPEGRLLSVSTWRTAGIRKDPIAVDLEALGIQCATTIDNTKRSLDNVMEPQ